ncbi:MAG: transglycosylase domain-containing protein, partial [Saprospiraceae bacterium]
MKTIFQKYITYFHQKKVGATLRALWKKKRVKFGVILFTLFTFYWFSLPNPLFRDPTCMVLEASNGDLLGARIAADGQWRFPQQDTIPDKFTRALIEFEDRNFYYHPGVDPAALGRALLQNIRNQRVVSGGSTITMQVIRLSRKDKPRNLYQKLVEMILAT